MKKSLCLLFCFVVALTVGATRNSLSVSFEPVSGAVSLNACRILTDASDDPLIAKVSQMFLDDYRMVTGQTLAAVNKPSRSPMIVFGTLRSAHIQKLVKSGAVDVSGIAGGVEQYVIDVVNNPFKGCARALVVVGCDPRGAAYGLLEISKLMGVSPWYWWADVPVAHHDDVYVGGNFVSRAPSVRYRGIFINDEDWGLTPWAAKTYEPEVGNIGPRTYARVCELLLRLKANMLAPAMHTCSDAFYTHPENKKVAGEYGIMITTSHCEPLLFNNASRAEWDSSKDGDWNYKTNRDVIYRKLDNRVKEAAQYENIYTMAMRGLHDEGMRGNMPLKEKVGVLHDAIMDQREILSRHISTPVDSIPQIFVPYKEAQELYENGLEVPEDITLVWPDDNYGYVKMLSNPRDRKRSGRAGVYYHISYLGVPHSYLWISTTAPMLMYEELKKTYDTGADRYWLLNVGDIKPMELSMQLFFAMAWDFPSFSYDNVNSYLPDYLCGLFGQKYRKDFQRLLDEYYRLAWSRKPEAMGWEREWDSPEFTGLRDTEFSFRNYDDAQRRLSDYTALSNLAARIGSEISAEKQPAYFEMIGYQALASNQMNRKFLLSQLNHELAADSDFAAANWAASQALKANDSIAALNRRYNTMLGGKWNHMMTIAPAICALNHTMPRLTVTDGAGYREVNLEPSDANSRLEGALYVPVHSFSRIAGPDIHSIRLLDGIGFDWQSLQLGEVTQPAVSLASEPDAPRVEYELPAIDADSVTVILYTVPRFPLYKGAAAEFGLSVDGSPVYVSNFIPKEQSRQWKDNVIRNAMITRAKFPIERSAGRHTLSIHSGTPGLIVERILIDWGGLLPTYVGPSPL